jgi:UDP-2-acetamido-3-amino-2,3-dideoxy-glucuronate N-acetyltransferase
MTLQVHPSAIVDAGAQIGDGTRVWHFVHVSGGARIGSNCSLGQGSYVGDDVAIGDNVKIQNNVSVYDAVTLEDDVFCGPSMVFTNVLNPRSAVVRKHEYRAHAGPARGDARRELHDRVRSTIGRMPSSAPARSSRTTCPTSRWCRRAGAPHRLDEPARRALDLPARRRRRGDLPATGERYCCARRVPLATEPLTTHCTSST